MTNQIVTTGDYTKKSDTFPRDRSCKIQDRGKKPSKEARLGSLVSDFSTSNRNNKNKGARFFFFFFCKSSLFSFFRSQYRLQCILILSKPKIVALSDSIYIYMYRRSGLSV